MTPRRFSRLLPAVTVAALLCLAAAAPQAPQMPAPPPSAAPCTDYSHTGAGDSVFSFISGDGITQPLPAGFTVAGCSLSVHGDYYTTAFSSAHEWDPTTLAPDPTTVALRSETVYPSAFYSANGYATPWFPFVPPIVTRSLFGVAEPPRTTIAVQVTSPTYSYFVTTRARYDPQGGADIPAASVIAAGGSHSVLQGGHPVVAHALCSGDDELQSVRVAQSVRRTDVALDATTDEIVQTFRVPEVVDLRWIELAIGTLGTPGVSAVTPQMPAPPPQPVVVGVVDPSGAPAPPARMPQTLVEALFPSSGNFGYPVSQTMPTWASHLDFDRTITLQPGRDYWLYVRAASSQKFLGRMLTGSEDGDFTAGVGALYTRGDSVGAWTPASDKVLAFKIVGRPAATTPVPARGSGFLMHVAPNPAGDIAQVTWSGAVGPMHLEVFDTRGRRVGWSVGGAAGTWAWAVTGRDGRPLPAGVYFVHGRDSAGQRGVERVVVVR